MKIIKWTFIVNTILVIVTSILGMYFQSGKGDYYDEEAMRKMLEMKEIGVFFYEIGAYLLVTWFILLIILLCCRFYMYIKYKR